MARPQKEHLDYFPHDCRASSNELLEIFEMKYPEGVGYSWYFKTLERIYYHQGELNISAAETRKILCRNISVDCNEILEYAVSIGLFDKKEYEENRILTSDEIKNNVKPVLIKREKMAQKYRNEVSETETSKKRTRKTEKTPIVEESIGEESKEKNTLSTSSKLDDGFNLEDKKQLPSDFDKQAAAHLEKAVRKLPPRKTGIANAKPTSWARHFFLLRTKDGIEKREIKRTLKWYDLHIGEEFVPEAYSGESFRKKYPAIVRQCERTTQEPVEITQEARELAADIESLSWPPAATSGLPDAVQRSLAAFETWRSDLISHSKKLSVEHEEWNKNNMPLGRRRQAPADTQFAKWLVSVVPSPVPFIRGWFTEIHRQVGGWEAWDGNLSRFVFRPAAKRFQKIGEQWAVDFTGNPERWKSFCAGFHGEEK